MNWSLVGMRGAGKSWLVQLWARKFSATFIDLDSEIEAVQGATIPEIVDEYGWNHFRKCEAEVLRNICETNKVDTILATGAGVIEDPANREILKEWGRVLWVDVPLEVLEERVAASDRPAVIGQDAVLELADLYERRKEIYASLADEVLKPYGMEEEEVVHEIERLWLIL